MLGSARTLDPDLVEAGEGADGASPKSPASAPKCTEDRLLIEKTMSLTGRRCEIMALARGEPFGGEGGRVAFLGVLSEAAVSVDVVEVCRGEKWDVTLIMGCTYAAG